MKLLAFKPTKEHLLWTALTIVGWAGILGVVGLAEAPSNTPAAAVNTVCAVNADSLLQLVNAERAKLGAPQLAVDPVLATTAKQKFDDMVTNKYYGHDLTDGSQFHAYLDAAGVRAASAEDLDDNGITPEGVWSAWKNSPAHYKTLVDPQYTRVGISTACTDYTIVTETGGSPALGVEGDKVSDLTVLHLAAPEPAVQTAPAQSTTVENNTYNNYTTPPVIRTPSIYN